MSYVYIHYSKSKNGFYIGSTQSTVIERQRQHNEGFFKDAYTQQRNDWEIFYSLECESFNQALKTEKHIKKMKSVDYINNIAKHPEIGKKLLLKYNDEK